MLSCPQNILLISDNLLTKIQDGAELLARLQVQEDYIFCNPSEPMHAGLKKLRQCIYKKMHASRRARD